MSPAEILPCANGPLLVRGDFEIIGADGVLVDPRRGTIALCRCGASAIKPFCDGSHKLTGFRTDDDPPEEWHGSPGTHTEG